ncbi:MAG: hypothetical protein AAFQ90_06335 [Pseudomonadota bacterium]
MTLINQIFTMKFKLLPVALGLVIWAFPSAAQSAGEPGEQASAAFEASPQRLAERATYVDLVTLSARSELVVRAQIRRQTQLKPERAPDLAPGFARLYIQAETQALIAGNTTLGESLVYLVDVPLTAKGKAPKLKDAQVVLFANNAGPDGRGAAQLQLTGEFAQLAYSPELEERLAPILTSLVASDPPPIITGISDALAVPGTLVGESETQIFLKTQDRSPVSLTVLRRPGQPPAWGVSWGEIIDSSARPPEAETLRWFRLACALPDELPSSANLARDPAARSLAERDYAFVIEALGPCARSITATPQG